MNRDSNPYCMRFKAVVLIFLALGTSHTYSQEKPLARNTIYSELLGNTASIISLNYDRIVLKKNKVALSVNVGAGLVPSNMINKVLFKYMPHINHLIYGLPVSVNFLIGKRYNHIEMGLGATFQQGLYGSVKEYTKTLYGVVRLGYRYQKDDGGFFWKAGFTPFIPIKEYGELTIDGNTPEVIGLPFVPIAGVAFGYTF